MKTRSLFFRLFALVAAMMCSMSAAASDFVFSLDDVTAHPGELVNVPVSLQGENVHVLGFALTTPEAIEIVSVATTDRVINSAHFVSNKSTSNGINKLIGILYADSNTAPCLRGTSGPFVDVTLRIPDDANGEYTLTLTEMSVGPVGGQQIELDDVTATLTVTPWPPEAYAEFWVNAGNAQMRFFYDNQRRERTGRTYDLDLIGTAPRWCYDGTCDTVMEVVFTPSFADARPTSTSSWFERMTNLQTITGMGYLNTSEVTSMYYMFNGCSRLTSLDLSTFNTANVTDMNSMFAGCSSLAALDLSSFNTANVTNMSELFSRCTSLTSIDVSGFNTANVTIMGSMFDRCTGLTSLDLSNFNTAKVWDVNSMFFGCTGLTTLDLSSFNTASFAFLDNMFAGCCNLVTIYVGDEWQLEPGYLESYNMFGGCTSLVGGQGTTYDPDNTNAEYAHIDGGPDNPGYLTGMVLEAYTCYTPENTTLTFYYDNKRSSRSGTTYDLNILNYAPGWENDGTNSSVTQVVFDPSFSGAHPTSTCAWFCNMTKLQSITGMEYLNTSEVTIMLMMFKSCSVLPSVDVSHFNTANVIDMREMFYACQNLSSLDLSSFNTANVKNMTNMFRACYKLTSIDVSSFNTSSVIYMGSMFSGCMILNSLDISNFNTANVTDMNRMFYYSYRLVTIYVGDGWSTAAVTNSSDMFGYCPKLVGGAGTTYDATHVDAEYAHIDGGTANPGYFTDKSLLSRGDVDDNGRVNIADVTALIDYILSGDASNANAANADVDGNGVVNIADVTILIDYILSGNWN